MGVLDTTYTFNATDVVTSAKLNNVIDQTTFTSSAIATGNNTLSVTTSGQLKVNSSGITANELANDSVTTVKILDGNVTQAKTNNSLVPTGAIMAFGMNSVPTGWLACNGQSTSGYTALAALVGANVPDLRGYFVRGFGTNVDTVASGAFGVKQGHMFEDHEHAVSASSSTVGDHAHTTPANTDPGNTSDRLTYGSAGGTTATASSSAGAHSHTIYVTVGGANSGTAGAETRPYNIALLYCIKY
jgi:microcystin-dependent protein